MRYLAIVGSFICFALSANSALADRRVAFVVGNGAYKNVAQLPNPAIDSRAMAATLRNVGFEEIGAVPIGLDLDKARTFLEGEVAKYRDIVTKAGIAKIE